MALGGSFHLLMITVVIAVTSLMIVAGLRSARPDYVGRWLGGSLLVLWLAYNVYYFQPAVFAWQLSLPLQVCDILAFLAAVVLLRPIPLARAVVCLSAVPLAAQAVLTPTGDHDPSRPRFWLYWGLHTGIIAAALYDTVVKRYRPTVRDFRNVLIVDAAYVAIIFPLNLAFGWNYGYIAPATADGRTVLDVLGPWPQRAFIVVALVIALQTLMFGVVLLSGRRHVDASAKSE